MELVPLACLQCFKFCLITTTRQKHEHCCYLLGLLCAAVMFNCNLHHCLHLNDACSEKNCFQFEKYSPPTSLATTANNRVLMKFILNVVLFCLFFKPELSQSEILRENKLLHTWEGSSDAWQDWGYKKWKVVGQDGHDSHTACHFYLICAQYLSHATLRLDLLYGYCFKFKWK